MLHFIIFVLKVTVCTLNFNLFFIKSYFIQIDEGESLAFNWEGVGQVQILPRMILIFYYC